MPAHHYRPLDDVEKSQVIELNHLGLSQRLIADRLGRNNSAVGTFLKRYHERGTTENSPVPGRPTKVTEPLKRRLHRHTKSDRRKPLAELQNEVVPELSIRTVERVLRNENVCKRKLEVAKRPKLTKDLATKRLAWDMVHADWTEEDFRSVLWSDECSVEKSKDPRTDWVFQTPYEKWDINCIKTYEKGPGVKLMVR
jgi:transposase